MKPIQLQTQIKRASCISPPCKKASFLLIFVFVMQSITQTLSFRSVSYPGNETDHRALLAIKRQLLVPSNRVLSSWNDSIHHCSWEGVTCGRKHNRVSVLDLSSIGLAGTISPFIGYLSFLKVLKLYNNSLSGEIPSQLGHLFRLRELWLNTNKLVGEIPANISRCVNLRGFYLSNNNLEGKLPTSLGALSKLKDFTVYNNHLTGPLFDIIQNLTSLVEIDAGYNSFTGTIPNSVGRMRNLQALALSENNQLTGALPTSLFNISPLQVLEVNDNQLHGELPADVGVNIPRLTWFNLEGNNFTGLIPITIQNLTALEHFEIGYNSFIGEVPSYFGNFHNLNYLSLSENYLEGDINFIDTLVNCSQLRVLDLGWNHFTGILPKSVANLSTSLQRLFIEDTAIIGIIPEGITNLINLRYLYMEGNSFQGNIPSSFASLTSLQEIDFSRNNLSGPIPAFFSKFQSLYYLNLSYNDFEGRVPTNSVFANASAVFVAGNSRLCAGIKQLHLPRCIENRSTKRTKVNIPIISALVGVVAMAVGAAGLYLACIKKKKTPLLLDSMMGKAIMKLSYDMLLKATTGFCFENLLGAGSFGSVFKGILDGKPVAVKVLNLQHCCASKSFMAECNTLKNARHRNLVGIVTACSSIDFQRNDFRALVYEYMPNGSLGRWLHGVDRNMSLAQRVDVAIHVAHAISYLHHECETPIVHCDLKPSNILLDNDMVAHVGDFGLARFLTQPRHPNPSSTIGIKGTIGYAAPEYGLGSEASTDGDVYSYGILLLELMTGKSPTDNMFNEGYNLHNHAETALPDQVLQIVDPSLEEDNISEELDDTRGIQDELLRRVECISSVISVGVSCSNHFPQERIKIVDARSRLESARDALLSTRNRRNLPARALMITEA